jgi:hypothetical protein
MTPGLYALFDMGLSFGAVLAFGIWQLRSLARGEKHKTPPGSDGAT